MTYFVWLEENPHHWYVIRPGEPPRETYDVYTDDDWSALSSAEREHKQRLWELDCICGRRSEQDYYGKD
jgi:hypothetical protein